MPNAYSTEQLNKLHEKLPKELLDALFSEETSEIIGNACGQYGIEDERVAQVAKYVGDVLIGLILPSEFEDELRKNVDMPEVLVKAIGREINRFVFYPVKASLRQLHSGIEKQEGVQEIGIPTPRHGDKTDDYIVQADSEPSSEQQASEEKEEEGANGESTPKKQDSYRESIE